MTKTRGKAWGGWLAALLVVATAVGTWMATRHKAGADPAPATAEEKPGVAVTVEPVHPQPLDRTVTVVGSLYGKDEVTISPKVEGRVVRIHKDVGDVVKPGAVLLEIDPTDYRLAVAEARRALELELARLGLKQLPAREFGVEGLPIVRRASAMERNAVARHERMRRLGVDGAASVEERQMAERDHAVALADYRVAVLEAEATLAAARHRAAVLDTAQQRLDDTRIVAPDPAGKNGDVEYVVCQRSVVEGEIVRNLPIGDNMTLFRLVIDRPLKLMATVPERHRARVRAGQPVTLEVEAYPGERFQGEVARVNPSVDRASRSFQIEVRVANADRRLSPGSFVRAAVQTGTDPAARLVPEEALVSFAGVSKVFVVKDDTAREVRVRLGVSVRKGGATTRTYVEVDGDLPPGSLVVTSGQSKLFDGTPVRVRSTK